jgi:hypothetical protein
LSLKDYSSENLPVFKHRLIYVNFEINFNNNTFLKYFYWSHKMFTMEISQRNIINPYGQNLQTHNDKNICNTEPCAFCTRFRKKLIDKKDLFGQLRRDFVGSPLRLWFLIVAVAWNFGFLIWNQHIHLPLAIFSSSIRKNSVWLLLIIWLKGVFRKRIYGLQRI